jgi:hypothetical protein
MLLTYKVVAEAPQVQAELAQVLESKLITNSSIPAEQLNEAVLTYP